jgi:hypothetical protein
MGGGAGERRVGRSVGYLLIRSGIFDSTRLDEITYVGHIHSLREMKGLVWSVSIRKMLFNSGDFIAR